MLDHNLEPGGRAYLRVPFVLVPDEPQLGVGGHGVVGADVAVEQGTLHPDGLPGQNPVALEVHRPVDAAVHCGERAGRGVTHTD